MKRLRTPAVMALPPEPAQALTDDPGALIASFYEKVWREQMIDLPFVNPALGVEAVGFRQVEGDWVGVVITPWFINLFLLPGGGSLWQDLPSGEQRGVEFPAGRLDFIADNNPDPEAPLGAYQYCPLIHPVQHLADQATARQAAAAVLSALFTPPAVAVMPVLAETIATSETPADKPEVAREPAPGRRAFLRGLAGKRRAP